MSTKLDRPAFDSGMPVKLWHPRALLGAMNSVFRPLKSHITQASQRIMSPKFSLHIFEVVVSWTLTRTQGTLDLMMMRSHLECAYFAIPLAIVRCWWTLVEYLGAFCQFFGSCAAEAHLLTESTKTFG